VISRVLELSHGVREGSTDEAERMARYFKGGMTQVLRRLLAHSMCDKVIEVQEAREQEEADEHEADEHEADEHEAVLRAHEEARREQDEGEDSSEADGGYGSPLGVDGQYSGAESPLGLSPLARFQTSRQPEGTDRRKQLAQAFELARRRKRLNALEQELQAVAASKKVEQNRIEDEARLAIAAATEKKWVALLLDAASSDLSGLVLSLWRGVVQLKRSKLLQSGRVVPDAASPQVLRCTQLLLQVCTVCQISKCRTCAVLTKLEPSPLNTHIRIRRRKIGWSRPRRNSTSSIRTLPSTAPWQPQV